MRDCRNIRVRDVELVYPEQRAFRLARALPVLSGTTSSMLGKSTPRSNQLATSSRSTDGAKRRKLSRHSLSCSAFSAWSSSADQRESSARGSEFNRALEPADRFHRLDRRSRESIPYTAESVNPLGYRFFGQPCIEKLPVSRTHTHRRRKGYRRLLPRATLANLLSRFLQCSGLLSHLRSCECYDEPETLPYSVHPVCPMSADGGQLVDHENEIFAFPNGRYDDQVDALVQALAYKRPDPSMERRRT